MNVSRAMFRALIRAPGASKARMRSRPPKAIHPDHLIRAYYARLNNGPLHNVHALVRARVLPGLIRLVAERSKLAATHDAADDLGELLDGVKHQMDQLWPRSRYENLVNPIGKNLEKFNADQLNRQLKQYVSVDVVGSESWLQGAIKEFTVENVALVKSISTEFLSDLEKKLAAMLADGGRVEDLAGLIEERYGVAQSRAQLIARDQVGKFNGDLNRVRQQDIGIESFVWRTMNDERVRSEHEDLDGQKFAWNDPPAEGTPGEPVACRCYAEPVIEETQSNESDE